jgi:hypothetical protein
VVPVPTHKDVGKFAQKIAKAVARIPEEVSGIPVDRHDEGHRPAERTARTQHSISLFERTTGIGKVLEDLTHQYRVYGPAPERKSARVRHNMRPATSRDVHSDPSGVRIQEFIVKGLSAPTDVQHTTSQALEGRSKDTSQLVSMSATDPPSDERSNCRFQA